MFQKLKFSYNALQFLIFQQLYMVLRLNLYVLHFRLDFRPLTLL